MTGATLLTKPVYIMLISLRETKAAFVLTTYVLAGIELAFAIGLRVQSSRQ